MLGCVFLFPAPRTQKFPSSSGEEPPSVFRSSALCPFMYALYHRWVFNLQQLHNHLSLVFGRVRVYGWGGVKSVCLSTFCFMCNRSLRYTGQILLLSHLSNEKTKVQKLREWPKVTAWQGQGRNRFLFPSPISLISQIATSQQKGQGTER